MVRKYTEFIIRRPILTIAVLLILTVVLGSGIRKVQFDASLETYVSVTDPEYKLYKKVKSIYGDVDTFVILDITHENLWSRGTFREIDNLLTDLEEYQKYDAGREEARLGKLDSFLTGDGVRWEDLMKGFSGDPPFVRHLKRSLPDAAADTLISRRQLENIRDHTLELKKLKEVKIIDDLLSPFTSKDIIGKEDTLVTVHLIEKDAEGKRILPETREEFKAFQQKLLRNPVFDRGIYSKDPRTGEITDLAIMVRFTADSSFETQDAISREVVHIAESYSALHILTQGQPLIYMWTVDSTRADVVHLIPLSFLVVMLILYLNFRSFRGVILPTLTLSMSTLWVFGLMGHMGVKITAIDASLPVLLICVGSAYSIHVLNQYYEDLALIRKGDKYHGLLESMSHINVTVGIAGFTTIISFWTVLNHQLAALRWWALFSGLGVAFAVLIAMTMIPAGLSLLSHAHHRSPREKKKKAISKDFIDYFVGWLTSASLNHPGKVLTGVVIVLLISLIGVFMVKVETEPLMFFKEHSYIRTSEKIIEEKFAGRWGFFILLDSGKPDGVKDTRYLDTLDEIRAWLESDTHKDLNIGRTDAFTDYLRTMNMAMNNDDPAAYAVPSSNSDIADYLEIYSDDDDNSDGRPDSFEPYVDQEYRTCNILTRLCQREDYLVGSSELERIFQKISDHLSETLPPPYTFEITGEPKIVIKSAAYITGGQIQSLLQSMVVISVVVLIVVRNMRAGLLALIPLLLAVTLNFGIMGWFDIPLDVATSVIAAITIGIGDDVTIHFINTWRHRMKAGSSIDDSIREALAESGRANIFVALALMAGFGVCFISTFKPVVLFGFLMAVVLTANNIGALLILPSAIKVLGLDLNVVKEKESFRERMRFNGDPVKPGSIRNFVSMIWNGKYFTDRKDK